MKVIQSERARKPTRQRSHALSLALAGVFVAAMATGLPHISQAAPSNDLFTIGAGTEPDTLDVQGQGSTAVMNYMEFVVEPLVRLEPDGSLSPALAESWETSEDGLQVTFHLRKNVKFQDGSPFNAEAVKFNFDRVLDKKIRVPLRGYFETVDKVKALDDHTVRITLTAPTPAFVGSLVTGPAAMMSPASINKHGNSYEKIVYPVGTGPFKFREYVGGDHLTFDRWDSYWGKKPYYKTIKILIMPEPASREAAVLSGQADMIMQPPSVDIDKLKKNPKIKVIIGPTTRVVYMAMNNQSTAFSDVRVRQALNYAVDKQSIIKNILFGAATPTHSPLSNLMASYCDTGFYKYDPEKARKLLSEAGATDLTVKLIAPNGHYIQDRQATQAIAAYFQQVGVKSTVRTTDWATYLAWVAEPSAKQGAQINMFGYAGSTPAAATPGFALFAAGSSAFPPNGYNTAFYQNEKFDKLWKEAGKEPDKQKRDDLYCQAQKIMWADAPWVFLWNQGIPIVTSANITGVETLPNEMYRAYDARPLNSN
ncbi:ABC transporter substrate-binding protein [Polaromonas sp. C04]|uniref:ABC transporter substrate-binding protein n=1 Tax=Polaromonas sp. C04 TaxID=1945857 RepID=UPI000986A93C|nr:ABC transporter substrate-binding protein [Polaromonas sp. C04]